MTDHDEKAKQILLKRDECNERSRVRKNRIARIVTVLVAVMLTAAIAVTAVIASRGRRPQTPADVPGTVTRADTVTGPYLDGVIGENKESELGFSDGLKGDAYKSEAGVAERSDSYSYYPKSGMPDMAFEPSANTPDAKAGTLTAGEWKDLAQFDQWLKKLGEDEFGAAAKNRKLDTSKMIRVKVTDEGACFNVPVKLISGGETVFTARTDINGEAFLFTGIDGKDEKPDSVSVGDMTVALDGRTELEINAKNAGVTAEKLDLMLMIDTTGSMGDELEYIKAELADLVSRVSEADKTFSIRVSVNFYRDEGDLYVVKYFDFRSDVNECLELMKDEHADGGGDYPEAVHTALENAVTGHQWRDDAVKLCFFVLDAPPHTENDVQGINENMLKSLRAAAALGVRIIPVASSGVNLETEVILRSFAVITGGTYIFITNDSGIGGDHKEAEVGEHVVESLNECMIRVACEYCGIYKGEKIPYTQTYHQ